MLPLWGDRGNHQGRLCDAHYPGNWLWWPFRLEQLLTGILLSPWLPQTAGTVFLGGITESSYELLKGYLQKKKDLSISVTYIFASTHEGNNINVQQINALSCPVAFPPPLQNRSRVRCPAWLLSCYRSYRLDLFCLFTKALATSFLILMPTKRKHSGLEVQGQGLCKTETSLTSENGYSTLFTSRWLPQPILIACPSLPTPLSTQSPKDGLPPHSNMHICVEQGPFLS